MFNGRDELEWIANPMYDSSHLICKSPSDYISLDIRKGVSIYRQFEENPEIFLYVPNPALKAESGVISSLEFIDGLNTQEKHEKHEL